MSDDAPTSADLASLEADVARIKAENAQLEAEAATWTEVETLLSQLPALVPADDKHRFRALLGQSPTVLDLLVLLEALVAPQAPAELRAHIADVIARARAFPELAGTKITAHAPR